MFLIGREIYFGDNRLDDPPPQLLCAETARAVRISALFEWARANALADAACLPRTRWRPWLARLRGSMSETGLLPGASAIGVPFARKL
jgi:hypothetical protein